MFRLAAAFDSVARQLPELNCFRVFLVENENEWVHQISGKNNCYFLLPLLEFMLNSTKYKVILRLNWFSQQIVINDFILSKLV